MLNIDIIRKDFPILSRTVYGKPLIYLDNGATTQIPRQVLECISEFYSLYNANIHRGIHYLSDQSTEKFEEARETVKRYLHAGSPQEIIFTQGTTDSINLVAGSYGEQSIGKGDEVIISQLEHHSNLIPWQMLCRKKNAVLRVIPDKDGELCLDRYAEMLNKKTRLVAVTQVSNLTGTVTPLRKIIDFAHENGTPVLVDGAQGVRHENVDIQSLGCDFYCFSGHKMMAPSGIGVLYAKHSLLERLDPCRFGGGIVDQVTNQSVSFVEAPHKFEAGTPNYAGAVALGSAIEYIRSIGKQNIERYEASLISYAETELKNIPGLMIIGQPSKRAGVVSFSIKGIHPYDLASILDKMGIAVRSGTHCAQPAVKSFGLESVTRVSPAFYNTKEEIDALVGGIYRSNGYFNKWKG